MRAPAASALALVTGLALALALGVPRRGAAAPEEPPPLVVFYAPFDAPPAVETARRTLARAARAEGSAFLDESPAPPPSPTAALRLRRAVDGYEAFRHDEAARELDAAIDEAARTGGAGLSASELSDLFVYRGMVRTQLGDTTRAWEDFSAAAILEPTRLLDPLRFPPRVIETFERALAAVRGAPRGTLAVAAPAGCDVVVDGRRLPAGLEPELVFGTHFVRIACPGRAPWGGVVPITQPRQRVEPELVPPSPPSPTDLAARAREAGGRRVLLAVARVRPAATPVLELSLLDAGSARPRGTALVVLDGARAADEVAAAVRRLVRGATRPEAPPPTPPPPPPRWFERPWFWGAVGAAAAAIVLLPFVADGDPAGFDVRPTFER